MLRSEQISKADFFIRNNLIKEPDFQNERLCLISISTKPVQIYNFGKIEKFTDNGIILEDGSYKYFNKNLKIVPCFNIKEMEEKLEEILKNHKKKVEEANKKIKDLDAKIIREARQKAKDQFDKLRKEKSEVVKSIANDLEKAFWK